jgi:hypothetical protein
MRGGVDLITNQIVEEQGDKRNFSLINTVTGEQQPGGNSQQCWNPRLEINSVQSCTIQVERPVCRLVEMSSP